MSNFEDVYSKIEKLADLMHEKGLRELDVSDEDFSINLVRDIPKQFRERDGHSSAQQNAESEGVAQGSASELSNITNVHTDASIKIIESPMVGVFYEASSPEAQAFVKVGDTVKAGDTLCIIESMKLMNEITAEYDGIIEELCASNEQVVDVGMPLFKIKV